MTRGSPDGRQSIGVGQIVGGGKEARIRPLGNKRERVSQHERVNVCDDKLQPPRDGLVDELHLVLAECLEGARAPVPLARGQRCAHREARDSTCMQLAQGLSVGCADEPIGEAKATHVPDPCNRKVEADRVDEGEQQLRSLATDCKSSLPRELLICGLCDRRRTKPPPMERRHAPRTGLAAASRARSERRPTADETVLAPFPFPYTGASEGGQATTLLYTLRTSESLRARAP
eukprot:scaffold149059_cov32-Tisochrysis_lutea.AAC.2